MSDFSIFTKTNSSFLLWSFFFCVSGGEKKRSGSAQILIGWLGFHLIEPDSSVILSENACEDEHANHFHLSVFFCLSSFFKQVNTHMKSKTRRLQPWQRCFTHSAHTEQYAAFMRDWQWEYPREKRLPDWDWTVLQSMYSVA